MSTEAQPGPESAPPLRADLVLEGGGVKGIGLVGAVGRLAAAGYTFPRVAGSSAGAIVGAFVAALQRAGEPLGRLDDVARSIDYRRFRDRGPLGRLAGPAAPLLDALSLAFESGVYEGEYLRSWLSGALRDLGIRTFGDLRSDDGGSDLPTGRRYSLVVTASDVSRQRLIRLPWDYATYGLDGDVQEVADAVRASAALPFYFEPITLRAADGRISTLVDGGVLSNFPIALFDRTDERPPRWPTFGIRLTARPGRIQTKPVKGPVSLALSVVETMLEACDAVHIDEPCVQARTVFVDSAGVSPTDFDISEEQQERLLHSGNAAAANFLAGWDWARYLADCRGFEL
jgi:NTE family protein